MNTKIRWTLFGCAALALLGAVALSGSGEASCVPVEPVDPLLEQWDEVSACGGFAATRSDGTFALVAGGYCDAEVLRWAYDAETETLALYDERVILNCCGDHAMELTLVGDIYVARETDEPEGGSGRCHCLCVFDFHVEASAVPEDVIRLRLDRFVTEEGESTVWEGTLDLGEGAGAVILDETDAGPWCAE